MAIEKVKPDGGSGGRLGHSNMTHWTHTDEIKDAARKHRRAADKDAVCEGLEDYSAQLNDEVEAEAR